MKRDLTLHIVLQKPPIDVDFGLQKGSGAKYETVQTQRSGLHDLHFDLSIEIIEEKKTGDQPRFSGPFVQGKPESLFIYIDIGQAAGQASGWSRRLKIPLTGITWDIVDQMTADPKIILETSVPDGKENPIFLIS
jgi:hypothetical protein